MAILKKERWWAYLDTDNRIHVKRYVDDKSIQRYEQLPMVKGIFDPFWCWGQEDAQMICYQKLKEVVYHEKQLN